MNAYAPARRLLIVGAVQIAQSLAEIARTIGFDVIVNDPRERFLTPERFPGATLVDAWPDEAVRAFVPNAHSAVVALSHDIKIDDPALAAALQYPTGYVGALGSRANQVRRAGAARRARHQRRESSPASMDRPACRSAASDRRRLRSPSRRAW